MERDKPQHFWVPQPTECGWGSKERDQEVRVNMAQPVSCRLAFCKIPWKPALVKFLRQAILVKLRWQLQNKGAVRAATTSFKPQTSNHASRRAPVDKCWGSRKGMEDKLWHIILLLSHRTWTQGLECGCLRIGTSSLTLLKNLMAACLYQNPRFWWATEYL